MVTWLFLDTPHAYGEQSEDDVIRSQSLSGVSGRTHAGIKLRITDSCDGPGKMLLLTFRGTIGQRFEQYPAIHDFCCLSLIRDISVV